MPRSKREFPNIRIAGNEYRVVIEHRSGNLNEQAVGTFSMKDRKITIDPEQHPEDIKKTLLHELVHAANICFGHGDMSEEQVLSVENGLWAIFKDNPGLAESLFAEEKKRVRRS